jgi:hypothetical protein
LITEAFKAHLAQHERIAVSHGKPLGGLECAQPVARGIASGDWSLKLR